MVSIHNIQFSTFLLQIKPSTTLITQMAINLSTNKHLSFIFLISNIYYSNMTGMLSTVKLKILKTKYPSFPQQVGSSEYDGFVQNSSAWLNV